MKTKRHLPIPISRSLACAAAGWAKKKNVLVCVCVSTGPKITASKLILLFFAAFGAFNLNTWQRGAVNDTSEIQNVRKSNGKPNRDESKIWFYWLWRSWRRTSGIIIANRPIKCYFSLLSLRRPHLPHFIGRWRLYVHFRLSIRSDFVSTFSCGSTCLPDAQQATPNKYIAAHVGNRWATNSIFQ